MSKEELSAYYRHLDNTVILKDNIYTSRGEGLLEGREMGRKEGLQEGRRMGREEGLFEGKRMGREEGLSEGKRIGREEGVLEGIEKAKVQMLKNLKSAGASVEFMMDITALTKEEIEDLL